METGDGEAPNAAPEEGGKRAIAWPALGSILNDIWLHLYVTLGLIYSTRVVGLTNLQAGLLMASVQVGTLFANIVFGYICESANVPCISRRVGRKKMWHAISTVLLAFFVLMAFNQCWACNDESSSWVRFAYLAVACGAAGFMCGGAELSHLSLLPDICEDRDDSVAVNTYR